MAEYIELHARSAYSFLRGASQPAQMVLAAACQGISAIALTDRDGVYGSAQAHYAAREINQGEDKAFEEFKAKGSLTDFPGIRSIVGAELTMEDGTALPVLVRTRDGYQNLCRLITRSKLRSPKGEGKVAWAELPEFAEGLVCLTGDEEGALRLAVSRGDCQGAEMTIRRLVNAFGAGNVYVEIQRHRIRGEGWLNQRLGVLARNFRLPLLATSGACCAEPGGRLVIDAFTCLRHHTTLDGAGQLLAMNSQRYLKSPREMQALFADVPEAITNTLRLAERLQFTLHDLGYEFPQVPTRAGESMGEMLYRETYAGARSIYGPHLPLKVTTKLDMELPLIERLGFCGYFLIIHKILKYAQSQNIMVQGRGSAANSVVCYCLGITKVDPTKHELLFERFLGEGRKQDGRACWPDVDLDLPSGDRREAIIQYVYKEFAPRGAAMTANVICYRGRSTIREMGKVLGISEESLGRFSDLYANGDFPQTLNLKEQLRLAGMGANHPRLPALLRLYHAVKSLPRHLGQHSGGMIISDRPLDTVVPLENASMPDRVVVQWDKDDCEDLGLVKIDFLGLGMMAVVQDTLELCKQRNRPVNWETLANKTDQKTFRMMERADTVGVFQIESRAQMATLPRMRPKTFYDVAIQVAIIRPGPIVGKLTHPYLERRNGREPVSYIEPIFESILERTLGVPLFQEQMLKMGMEIAGFEGLEAEELRRAMSFHRSGERMAKVVVKLYAAMEKRKVSPEVQKKVVESIQAFALYGFPESHAISFALIAYGSTWLKVHRAAEFYASLLNNQPMGFYSASSLVFDARHHGLRVRPVCIVESGSLCSALNKHTIRLGLNQVRGLSAMAQTRILAERAGRPFTNLTDFLLRTRLAKDERRVLAKIGALNALIPKGHRRTALWEVENHVDPDDLFSWAEYFNGGSREAGPESFGVPPPPLLPMNAGERRDADYSGTGLTTGPHPMTLIRAELPEVSRACDLAAIPHGQRVTIAGMVICRQRPGTAKGHVFISLEDETGIANAFVPSDTFEKNRLTITQERFLRITGGLQNVDNVVSVYAIEIAPLPYHANIEPKSYDFH